MIPIRKVESRERQVGFHWLNVEQADCAMSKPGGERAFLAGINSGGCLETALRGIRHVDGSRSLRTRLRYGTSTNSSTAAVEGKSPLSGLPYQKETARRRTSRGRLGAQAWTLVVGSMKQAR